MRCLSELRLIAIGELHLATLNTQDVCCIQITAKGNPVTPQWDDVMHWLRAGFPVKLDILLDREELLRITVCNTNNDQRDPIHQSLCFLLNSTQSNRSGEDLASRGLCPSVSLYSFYNQAHIGSEDVRVLMDYQTDQTLKLNASSVKVPLPFM